MERQPHLHEIIQPIKEIAQGIGAFIVEKIVPSEAVKLPEVEDVEAVES